MKKKAFTLIEMILALMVFGLLFGSIMSIYTRMINVKREFDARNYLLNTTYTIVEKLNILLKDYTIDYEEYFNRRMYGCAGSAGLMTGWTQGTTGYCSLSDWYGNGNPTSAFSTWGITIPSTGYHVPYGCSSLTNYADNATFTYVLLSANVVSGGGCPFVGDRQAYGEYRQQFIDIKGNADETSSPIGDDDDTEVGRGPVAIADNENVPELYLISKDKKSRLFLRRKLVQQNDVNGNGTYQPYERLYMIQMLQLRGFDAGTKHSFDAADTSNQYMYDGQIDTWACDYEKGFICNGAAVNTALYSGYNLPSGAEDGWVNLFASDATVSNWKFQIYPIKDPVYAWSENDMQLNPYIRLFISTHLYAPAWYTKIDMKILGNIYYDLQTTFNIKSNY